MITDIILYVFKVYQLIILARVVVSWINVDDSHPVVQWIYRLTEPVLEPIRRLIPMERIGIDLSPLIVLILMQLVSRYVL